MAVDVKSLWIATYCESLLNRLPELLGKVVAGVLDGEVSPLVHNLFGSVCTLGVSPSRVRPPLLDGGNLGEVLLFFLIGHGGCCC